MIYFDNASTTSVRTEVARVYGQLVRDLYGNSDSLHALGRKTNRQLETARERIAALLNVQPKELIFTSCGSEANTLATAGFALANQNRGKHILTSNVEHSSVHHAMEFLKQQGFDVEVLSVSHDGIITPDQVKDHMRKDTILVSVMHVNNESGAVNPIAAIADVVHQHPTACFHSDLVQSFAKEDIPMDKLDLASLSAHKLHGLKGSGLLVKKANVRIQPLLFGGQQEQGLRGGTSNAPADIVLAKTIRLALEEKEQNNKNVAEINRYLRSEIGKIPGARIQSPDDASSYILNVSFDSITSEVLMNALDAQGVCVSAKSTCESGSGSQSEVLLAMGRSSKEATHAIRLSFSGTNTMQEARQFMTILKEVLKQYGLPL